jgi:hypothetical protein
MGVGWGYASARSIEEPLLLLISLPLQMALKIIVFLKKSNREKINNNNLEKYER